LGLRDFFRVFILLIFIGLLGCEDDPASIGKDLLPDDDFIQIKEINSLDSNFVQSSKSFLDSTYLGSAQRLFIGKKGNTESSILLRFNIDLPDTIKAQVAADSINILSTRIYAKIDYLLGGTESDINFTVHEISSIWTPLGFNKDSLPALQYSAIDLSSSFEKTDSSISFVFDKGIVNNWLKLSSDSKADDVEGIYLKPTPATDGFMSFAGLSNIAEIGEYLTLEVIYEKLNSYTDTLNLIPTADLHVIVADEPDPNSEHLVVQGGVSIKSTLIFNLDDLPKTAIINRAILELTLDENASLYNDIDTTSMFIQLLSDSSSYKVRTDYSLVALSKATNNKYKAELNRYVQAWMNLIDNQGMIFWMNGEQNSLSKFAFIGSKAADPTLRPKLTITYTDK